MTVITRGVHAADTTAAPTKRTRTIDLDESFGPLFAELADVKLTLAEAQSRIDELNGEIKAAAGKNADKLETLVVRIGGVIRAKIGLRSRTNINAKELQIAFPEAYEACKSETEYQVVTPA